VIELYKRRAIRAGEDVWVYRNLMRTDGPWYSLVQRGLVVAHATEVTLTGCRFVVRAGGRRRTLESGVKNVHAFIVGRVIDRAPTWGEFGEALTARYSTKPGSAPTFERADPEGPSVPLEFARAAHLGPRGLTVYGPDPVL
jgi:hypothetical protein